MASVGSDSHTTRRIHQRVGRAVLTGACVVQPSEPGSCVSTPDGASAVKTVRAAPHPVEMYALRPSALKLGALGRLNARAWSHPLSGSLLRHPLGGGNGRALGHATGARRRIKSLSQPTRLVVTGEELEPGAAAGPRRCTPVEHVDLPPIRREHESIRPIQARRRAPRMYPHPVAAPDCRGAGSTPPAAEPRRQSVARPAPPR